MLQRRSCAIVLFAAVLQGRFAVAQTNAGQIAGRVTDSTGSVVPGCTVTSLNTETSLVVTTKTDSSGDYIFPSLPPATFNVRAEATGFRSAAVNGVILDAASKRTINFELQIGTVQETLEVTASAAQVQAASGEVSKVIYDKQLNDIALNGRNYSQMLRLVPGAVNNTLNSFDVALSTTAQNINGVRYNSTYFTIDGAENLDNGSNSNAVVNPSMDSIAEVRILTSSYSAEFGGRSGSLVNVVTKNGTKNFHGTLFEFVRNDRFDARSFFAVAVPSLRFNDFGWTLGGPVIFPRTSFNRSRNKLFFFASQEWKYIHEGVTNVGVVATALERQGNFQGSTLAAPKDRTNGNLPFPNAIVPANLFSVNGPKLLSPIPQPNFGGPGGNFSISAANRSDTREDLIRMDYYINSKNQLMYRWTHDTWAIWNAFQGTTLGFVPGGRPRPGYSTMLSLNTMITPTTLNYASFSVMDNNIKAADDDRLVSRAALGLTYPEVFSPHQYSVAPSVNIAGFTGYTPGNFIKNLNTTFKANDDVSKILGGHSLKFGAEVVRSRKDQNNSGGNEFGTVTFNTSSSLTSGNVIADALLGNFYTYTEGQIDMWWWSRYTSYEFYAQDSWRVNPRLTLEYGLRYNDIEHTTNGLGTWTMFLPSHFNLANAPVVSRTDGSLAAGTGNPYNGISLCGSGFPSKAKGRIPQASDSSLSSLFTGLPDTCVPNPRNNWSPRVGFSFSPNGKTAIRGGFGIFYDVIETDEYRPTSANPPFSNSATIYNGNIDNPGGATFRNFPAGLGTLDSTLPNPRIMTYNLDVQRELPSNVIVSVGYVGTLGRHLLRTLNINQLPMGTLTQAANKGVNANALVPFQGYGAINMIETGDNSNYNALQVGASKRSSAGLSYGVSYTFSKTLDTTAGQGNAPQDSYNAKPDYGLSSINRKNVLTFNYVYELPWLRGSKNVLARYVLGGWSLSGVTAFQAGAPNSVTVPSDVAGIGATSTRASVTGNPNLARGDRTLTQWFNTSVFVNPSLMTAGQFGNTGRNVLTGPGFSQWDVSLLKNLAINDKTRFQFRAETFNLVNHPSFTAINTTVRFDSKGNPASGFGAVSAAGPGRMLEFGLKFLF